MAITNRQLAGLLQDVVDNEKEWGNDVRCSLCREFRWGSRRNLYDGCAACWNEVLSKIPGAYIPGYPTIEHIDTAFRHMFCIKLCLGVAEQKAIRNKKSTIRTLVAFIDDLNKEKKTVSLFKERLAEAKRQGWKMGKPYKISPTAAEVGLRSSSNAGPAELLVDNDGDYWLSVGHGLSIRRDASVPIPEAEPAHALAREINRVDLKAHARLNSLTGVIDTPANKPIPGPIPDWARKNFNNIQKAAGQGHMALVSAIHKETGAEHYLITATYQEAPDGLFVSVPFGRMLDENPYDAYHDPLNDADEPPKAEPTPPAKKRRGRPSKHH